MLEVAEPNVANNEEEKKETELDCINHLVLFCDRFTANEEGGQRGQKRNIRSQLTKFKQLVLVHSVCLNY